MNATSRFPTPRAANRPGSVPISMRGLFLLCFMINVSGVVLLAILSVLMSWNEERLNQKHDQRLNSYMLADELRQSSDDLTRMARTYVVTQDPRYEQMYRDILAIRNGTKPRPRDYNRIYWDLVLRAGEKPRPDGPAEALEHLMRQAGFTPEEFSLLRTAQANSDNLVRTETIAMNAVKGLYDDGTGSFSRRGDPDIPLATRLMHDAKYHAEKARIMAPIYDFFARLDQRTRADVDLYLSRGRILLLSIQAVVVLLIGLSIATGLLLPRAIFRRVGGEPFLVEHVVRRIAEGDLAVSIGTSGWARNGIMAAMRETTDRLRRVVRGVQAAVDVIAESSQTMLVGSDSLAATAGEQATATAEAAAAMDQMAEAVAKTAENAQRTEQLTQVASQDARDSGEAVAETVVAMRSIAEKLSAVEGITRRTQMISINAAIEAARAGAVGREFAVVATEVRALAEHTQAITLEMNRLISLSRTIAEKAGAMLAKLIPDIEQTARLVAEISAHTRAQSEGARQIKIAIRQLVQGTHECSTSSSDLSALAERLSEESRRLQDSIAFFHLPDEETPAFPSGTVDPRPPRALPATAITRR